MANQSSPVIKSAPSNLETQAPARVTMEDADDEDGYSTSYPNSRLYISRSSIVNESTQSKIPRKGTPSVTIEDVEDVDDTFGKYCHNSATQEVSGDETDDYTSAALRQPRSSANVVADSSDDEEEQTNLNASNPLKRTKTQKDNARRALKRAQLVQEERDTAAELVGTTVEGGVRWQGINLTKFCEERKKRRKYNDEELRKAFQDKVTITQQMADDAGIHWFEEPGIYYGYIIENGAPVIVLAARITRLDHMSQPELQEVEMVGQFFHDVEQVVYKCMSNGAHVKMPDPDDPSKMKKYGSMWAIGWRRGYSDTAFGVYAHNGFGGDEGMELYVNTQQRSDIVAQVYQRNFYALAPLLERQCFNLIKEEKLPQLGTISYDPNEPPIASSASNLTVVNGRFANAIHKDLDSSAYTYGEWFTSDMNGKPVLIPERLRNRGKGGHFMWPFFGVGVRIRQSVPVKVQIVWRGKDDEHCTVMSDAPDDDLKDWGSSVQVNTSLLKAVRNMGDKEVDDLAATLAKVGWVLASVYDDEPALDNKEVVGTHPSKPIPRIFSR